jgi:DnaJ-class molecular chaperone
MTTAKNYYELLGLHYEAEDVVIRAAYKALAQKYHPDKSIENIEQATLLMKKFSEAYQVLSDPKLRKRYDEVLSRKAFSELTPQPRSAEKTKTDSSPPNTTSKPFEESGKAYASGSTAKGRGHFEQSNSRSASARDREVNNPLELNQQLIEKIEANQIDEGHMVALFEKLFERSITVHHGMLNSYSFEFSGKRYNHNFSTLKTAILKKLQEAKV